MKRNIYLTLTTIIAFAFALPLATTRAADDPTDPKLQKKAAPAAKAPVARAPVAKAAPAARAPVAKAPVARAPIAKTPATHAPVATTTHRSTNVQGKTANNPVKNAAAPVATTKHTGRNQSATAANTNAAPAGAQTAQTRGTHSNRGTNANQAQSVQTQTAAPQGGGQYTRANSYGGRWTSGNNHPDWNQGQVNNWDGHQYRWYDGGWLMVDGGFWPVPGGYQGGGSMMAGAQQQLTTDGYYSGAIDGIPGPGTRQAIANYQSDNSLPVTGHLNAPTRQSLGLVD